MADVDTGLAVEGAVDDPRAILVSRLCLGAMMLAPAARPTTTATRAPPVTPGRPPKRRQYEGNEGTAIYNSSFRPFQSPVPFLFVRHTVLDDWKFFVDDDALLERWARRFGPSATGPLAKELRRLPWRVGRP